MNRTDIGEAKGTEPEPPGRLRAGITFNLKKGAPSSLPDAEAEFDELDTILAIQNALEESGFVCDLLEASESLPSKLLQFRPDVVFNIAEGMAGRGREAQVPAILSFLRIPFTGSDETTMCIAMDKALTKRIVASYGVNTPAYRVIGKGAFPPDAGPLPDTGLSFPIIIKPNTEGSSKGISSLSVVEDAPTLSRVAAEKIRAYRQDMLLEEYIPGREFTVGILGNGENLRIFPPMEILFLDNAHSIYSYDVKRDYKQYVRYACPPDADGGVLEEIKGMAETVYRALACRDLARMDFRLSPEGRPYFIEINPLPGLAPGYSDFPILADFCGMDYTTLIREILYGALSRYGIHYGSRG